MNFSLFGEKLLRGVDLIEPEGEMRKTVAFVYPKRY
jgi:hypothetical protein